ncbi:hypothetical protein [Streptomyces sp. NPDC002676]
MVEAAAILASTPGASREFKQAVADFGTSRNLAESNEQRAQRLVGPAKAALAQDDALRDAKASLIEQGNKAEKKLGSLLHGRLTDAIRARTVVPVWFVTVLGGVPPANNTVSHVVLVR